MSAEHAKFLRHVHADRRVARVKDPREEPLRAAMSTTQREALAREISQTESEVGRLEAQYTEAKSRLAHLRNHLAAADAAAHPSMTDEHRQVSRGPAVAF